jgi:hypothetical protein
MIDALKAQEKETGMWKISTVVTNRNEILKDHKLTIGLTEQPLLHFG